MAKIFDCTIREGGYENNWNFDDEFIFNLIETLNLKGVSYFEIGYRNYYEADGKGRLYRSLPAEIKKFYNSKGNLKIGVMVDVKRFSESDFSNAYEDFLDFVRIAAHPNEINKALEISELLKSRNYKVFLQLMDISKIEADGYITLYGWENKDILESLYFADSYGTLDVGDIVDYYNKLKMLRFDKISFHGHNCNGKVLENTIKAIKLGAFSIDTTINSKGRFGGNLKLDEYINALNL